MIKVYRNKRLFYKSDSKNISEIAHYIKDELLPLKRYRYPMTLEFHIPSEEEPPFKPIKKLMDTGCKITQKKIITIEVEKHV